MILFRAAAKQIARRHGLSGSFMCRPGLPNLFSSGWHLHQSLIARKGGAQRFRRRRARRPLHARPGFSRRPAGARPRSRRFHHADRQRLQALPRLFTLAPDRAIWARDNRGVMLRVLGEPGDPATHLENRVGEPAANPYLYIASQIHAGLDGIASAQARSRTRGRYALRDRGAALPKNLGEALAALTRRPGVPQRLRRRLHRLLRPHQRSRIRPLHDRRRQRGRRHRWEQNEYFDLF